MNNANRPLHILVVEDNPGDFILLKENLRLTDLPIEVYHADSISKIRGAIDDHPVQLVFLDLYLPDSAGLGSFVAVNELLPQVPIIVLSGLADTNAALEALSLGAQDYLVKGEFDEKLLLKSIKYCMERKKILENIRESKMEVELREKRFRALIENSAEGVIVLAPDGTIIDMSHAGKRILGYNVNQPIENIVSIRPHPQDNTIVSQTFFAIVQNPNAVRTVEYRIYSHDGTIKWLEVTYHNLLHEPAVKAIVLNYRDISERKEAEQALVASEKRYKYLFNDNPMPMWIYDIETHRFIEVNAAAVAHYGYTREEFLLMTIQDIGQEPADASRLEGEDQAGREHRYNEGMVRHLKKNGEPMYVELTSHLINFKGRRGMLVLSNDVTEKIRLQGELLEEKISRQKEITRAAINAQEKERAEIGKELHDNVNQILSTIKMYLDYALSDDDLKRELVERSINHLATAIDEIRKLSKSLVPPTIGDMGLIQSIEELVENIQLVQKKKIQLEFPGFDETALSEGLKLTIFRITQEQLNNVLKHAHATEIKMQIQQTKNSLKLTIADNGTGFDLAARRKGVGITNIINRADLYNGKVEISTAPGAGCRLRVFFELNNTSMPLPDEGRNVVNR